MTNFSVQQMFNQWPGVLLVGGDVDREGEERIRPRPNREIIRNRENIDAMGECSLRISSSEILSRNVNHKIEKLPPVFPHSPGRLQRRLFCSSPPGQRHWW